MGFQGKPTRSPGACVHGSGTHRPGQLRQNVSMIQENLLPRAGGLTQPPDYYVSSSTSLTRGADLLAEGPG